MILWGLIPYSNKCILDTYFLPNVLRTVTLWYTYQVKLLVDMLYVCITVYAHPCGRKQIHEFTGYFNLFKTETAQLVVGTGSHRSQQNFQQAVAHTIRVPGYCNLMTTFNLMYLDFWGTITRIDLYMHQIKKWEISRIYKDIKYRVVPLNKTMITRKSYKYVWLFII